MKKTITILIASIFFSLALGSMHEARAITALGYTGLSIHENTTMDYAAIPGVRVNTRNGNLIIRENLFQVSAKGIPVQLYLTYNSDHRAVSSPFGFGWNSSYNIRYTRNSNGDVTIVLGDGRQDTFTNNSGTFTAPPGLYMTLSEPAAGELLLTTKHGIKYRFADSTHKKLTSIQDPNGNTLTLSYDTSHRLTAVTDAGGRAYNLSYDTGGRLATITDPNLGNRAYGFTYDTSNRLIGITDPLANTDTFAYDTENLITGITDKRGDSATIAYTTPSWEASTRLPLSIAKGGVATTFAYDNTTRTTTITSPGDSTWKHIYDTGGRIATITDPTNNSSAFTWDANENLLTSTDRNGNVTTFTYDANGNQLTVTDPLGNVATRTYEPSFNRVASSTDPLGNVWSYQYDSKGNRTQTTDPLNNTITRVFDSSGQMTSFTNRTGYTFTFAYDSNGNLINATNPLSNPKQFVYDAGSRMTGVTNADNNTTTFAYDALDRLTGITDALGNSNAFVYDANKNLTGYTDRNGNTTTITYDALGRPLTVANPLGNSDSRTYDANGNLLTYTDFRGNNWTQTFDSLGRPTSRTNPTGGVWQYAYDAEGNITSHTDAKGQATTFTYDALGRITGQTFADATTASFTYDPNENMLTAVDANSSYTYTYDALNRRTQYTDNLINKTVQYTYDAENRLASKTGPGNNLITYTYDAAGRRISVTTLQGTSTFTRDNTGNITSEARVNGVNSTYAWSPTNLISSITHKDPQNNVLQSFVYTRDKEGRIVQTARETGEIINYTYDALGRVTKETGGLASGPYTLDLAYDANGNTTQNNFTSSLFSYADTFTYDTANRPLVDDFGVGTSALTHDANGSRTGIDRSNNNIDQFSYDARNRLVSFQPSWLTQPITYIYDIFNRLIDNSVLRFIYGSKEPIQTLDSGTGNVVSNSQPVCLFSTQDVSSGEYFQMHPGGNLLTSILPFTGPPITLITDQNGLKAGSKDYHANGDMRSESYDPPLSHIDMLMNGTGGITDPFSNLSLWNGQAYDSYISQPVNPGGFWGNNSADDAVEWNRKGFAPDFASTDGGATWSGSVTRKRPGPLPQKHKKSTDSFQGSPTVSGSLAPYQTDFASLQAYSFVSIVNKSSSADTITVSFHKDDGAMVASTSSSVAAGATWILSSASGLSPSGATGPVDFEGSATVSDTGGDAFVYYPAVAFPVSPGAGSPLALSGFPMTPVTVTSTY